MAPPHPAEPAVRLSSQGEPIVYGDDDRTDVYAYPDELFRERARNSVVALIEPWRVQQDGRGSVTITGKQLGDEYGLCDSERFVTQPSAADCSGVLIDYDLVLTAGHCFDAQDTCDRYKYVFNFLYRDEETLESVGQDDVYGCKKIVARTLSPLGSAVEVDFSIIQLDRAAMPPRQAAPIRRDALTPGEQVVVIGFTSGVPAKIDDGGQVIDPRSETVDYFAADTDTFSGSSGSPTFDQDGNLLGVLVRGGVDYSIHPNMPCLTVNEVGDGQDGSPFEHITYATRATQALCDDLGWPSARLCDAGPVCGDGICSPSEVNSLCVADCDTPVCLGRRCGKDGSPTCVGSSCLPPTGGALPLEEGGGDGAVISGRAGGCSAWAPGGRASAWWWCVPLAAWLRRRRYGRG